MQPTTVTDPTAVTDHPDVPAVAGHPRFWLRAEGLAAFIAGLALWVWLGGEWYWAVVAILVPDLSMLGYLRDARLGAFVYNLAHNWAVALVVLGAGLLAESNLVQLVGAILVAHVGMDRAAGYGLKYPSSFGDTHLGAIGRRRR